MTSLNLQRTLPSIEPGIETPLTLRAATVSEIAAEVARLSALGKQVEFFLAGAWLSLTYRPDSVSYFTELDNRSDDVEKTLEQMLRYLYALGNAQQGQK